MSSVPATGTDAAMAGAGWVCQLLQAGDSFYPTGSYAHSFGLEGLINEGVVRDRETLRTFVFTMALPGLGHAELPIVAHAWRAFAGPAWERIGELSLLTSAFKSAREVRIASENIGRQRAELAAMLHPDSLAPEYVRRAAEARWPFAAPVSAALEAHLAGAPLPAALAGYAYSALTSLLAAAMKLLRVGQNGIQALLTAALGALPPLLVTACDLPLASIGWSNPWLDIAAARHESADSRLFIS